MADIVKLVTELGSFGLLLGLAGWIIYNYVKDNPKAAKEKEEFKKMFDNCIADIKSSINTINNRVNGLETIVSGIKSAANTDPIEPTKPSHTKQFLDRLKLGPHIHKTLRTFCDRINTDHIFVGSFHNGNESLTGIPYFKFDIIAERFCKNKVEDDIEFAFMYKDAELLRHDLLPLEIISQDMVHYTIDDAGDSDIQDVDDILYRRMIGRGIKQIAILILRDPSGMPSGFVGGVKYNYEKLDLFELKECGRELESIYATNEKLINSKANDNN